MVSEIAQAQQPLGCTFFIRAITL